MLDRVRTCRPQRTARSRKSRSTVLGLRGPCWTCDVDALQHVTLAVLGQASRLHIGANAFSRSFSARTSLILGSLRRAAHRTAGIALLKKALFNLAVDPKEPLLSTIGSFPRCVELGFQLGDLGFGGAQLIRKLLRHAERVAAIFVGYAGGLRDQLQDGLTCFVELIVCARSGAVTSSRERNDVRILSELTLHHTTLHLPGGKSYRRKRYRGDHPCVRSFLFEGAASLQHQRLFLLIAVPAAKSPTGNNSREPRKTRWRHTMRRSLRINKSDFA